MNNNKELIDEALGSVRGILPEAGSLAMMRLSEVVISAYTNGFERGRIYESELVNKHPIVNRYCVIGSHLWGSWQACIGGWSRMCADCGATEYEDGTQRTSDQANKPPSSTENEK